MLTGTTTPGDEPRHARHRQCSSPPHREVRGSRGASPSGVWRSGATCRRLTRRARSPLSLANSPPTPYNTAEFRGATSASGSARRRGCGPGSDRGRGRCLQETATRCRHPRCSPRVSPAEGCSWWTSWPHVGGRCLACPSARRYGRRLRLTHQLSVVRRIAITRLSLTLWSGHLSVSNVCPVTPGAHTAGGTTPPAHGAARPTPYPEWTDGRRRTPWPNTPSTTRPRST